MVENLQKSQLVPKKRPQTVITRISSKSRSINQSIKQTNKQTNKQSINQSIEGLLRIMIFFPFLSINSDLHDYVLIVKYDSLRFFSNACEIAPL
jgi:hypothetical protein